MTNKYIYNPEDSAELDEKINAILPSNEQIENIIRMNKGEIERNGAVVIKGDMFDKLNQASKDIPKEDLSSKIFFTDGKGKVSFSIEGTILSPNPVVSLGGKSFEQKYIKQLEQIIFNDKDNLDPDKLIPLIILMKVIKENNYPIRLVSSKYKILMRRLTNALNTFFIKNYNVIDSMYTMFSGMNQMPNLAEEPRRPEDNNGN